MEQYGTRYEKTLAVRSEADAFHSVFGTVIRLLQMTVVVAVFTTGAFVFFADEITGGGIFAGVIIIARLFYPYERSLLNMKTAVEAAAAYKRLKQFVNTREAKPKLSLPAPEGRFSAESVGLSLDSRTVLYNISLALEPGETLGVFGPSASGKNVSLQGAAGHLAASGRKGQAGWGGTFPVARKGAGSIPWLYAPDA